MIIIRKENQEYELEFEGIKIIDCENPTKLYKDIFIDSKILIDNLWIKNEDIVYINELTKVNEFINLTKKSFVLEKILNLNSEFSILNNENILKIIKSINNEFNYEILSNNDGDIIKIVQLLFQTIENEYLNKNIFELILKNLFNQSKLIIFDNVSWANMQLVSKYINEHKFLILTNDIRNYIDSSKTITAVAVWNMNNKIVDLLDKDKVIAYLEKNLSEPINEEKIHKFLKEKNSLFSLRCLNLIKNM